MLTLRADVARIAPPAMSRQPRIGTVERGSQLDGGGKVDSMDRVLIGHLLEDCRATNRQLATATGISESAVSIRLKKLMSSGSLIFTALIDWEVAGFDWFVIARLKTRGSPTPVAAAITQLDSCEAVAVVVGAYDLVAYFVVRDRAELNQLVNDDLPAIDGLSEITADIATETAITDRGRQFFMAYNPAPIRLPNPSLEIDDLDIAVMKALLNDSRQSSRAVARALGVAEGTIRARIERLDKSGLCRIVAMAEPISMGYAGVVANVTLSVERSRLASIAEQLLTLPETVFLATTIGPAAMTMTVTARSHTDLTDLVSQCVRSIDGVLGSETLPMVDVVRFSPYLKRFT
ncbi:hypothetical protein CH306_25940 [Rhodococcus sp. 15-725-2-2b]|uniref:Lrp/AsnC family transcriptional regulator n=1 Tax=unclassified Rhodococcus (in: high G+C Gram-positive bacteria) TaxID=192944 RepID=UPI000B9B66FA|nr:MULTISPECIES: Lrp/AsnC family transcriptional regulator [unclassified Rhodococcus (in: high G+C Gram-positive bacteria)]OZC63657.1 hypothetical protein CH277_22720 [Rhodococcus sp. 06-469-3-2]OZD40822.1 hypothetical protein CH264_24405 [Rhodococcus sp. 06-1477-1A]OZE67070.1 hypothetical protein CH306_25940 [Rhodococcus sp. 15-725-2-2b]